jgi:hypothetical protein
MKQESDMCEIWCFLIGSDSPTQNQIPNAAVAQTFFPFIHHRPSHNIPTATHPHLPSVSSSLTTTHLQKVLSYDDTGDEQLAKVQNTKVTFGYGWVQSRRVALINLAILFYNDDRYNVHKSTAACRKV